MCLCFILHLFNVTLKITYYIAVHSRQKKSSMCVKKNQVRFTFRLNGYKMIITKENN